MTARQRVLFHLAELADEDVDALLPIVERLRAKRLVPTYTNSGVLPPQVSAPIVRLHPERFGALAGSVRTMGDVESPIEPADLWGSDGENLKP